MEGIVGALRKALAHGRDGHSDDIPLARSGALQTDPLSRALKKVPQSKPDRKKQGPTDAKGASDCLARQPLSVIQAEC